MTITDADLKTAAAEAATEIDRLNRENRRLREDIRSFEATLNFVRRVQDPLDSLLEDSAYDSALPTEVEDAANTVWRHVQGIAEHAEHRIAEAEDAIDLREQDIAALDRVYLRAHGYSYNDIPF